MFSLFHSLSLFIMYSFTDARFFPSNSYASADKSPPLLSPSAPYNPFHPLLPYSALSHFTSSASSQMQANHLPYLHPHPLSHHPHHHPHPNLHASRYLVVSSESFSVCQSIQLISFFASPSLAQPNYFIFPQLPSSQSTDSPKSSSPISSPTRSGGSPLFNGNNSPLAMKSSSSERSPTIVQSSSYDDKIKLFPSNKRKEYEAREEKKLKSLSVGGKVSNEETEREEKDTFSCPICSDTGFTRDSLNEHFKVELKRFRSAAYSPCPSERSEVS